MRRSLGLLRDDVSEAASTLSARPLRTLSTSLAFALGVASAVALLIAADSAQHQVSRRFDVLRATEVRLTASRAAGDQLFPTTAASSLRGLAGVERVGVANRLPDATLRLSAADDGRSRPSAQLYDGDAELLTAAGCTTSGAPSLLGGAGTRSAVIGTRVARDLGGATIGRPLLVDGVPFTVVGVAELCKREASFESAVVVNDRAHSIFGLPDPARSFLLIVTAPGASAVIARQAPLALSPEDPSRLSTSAVPDPRQFRQQIEGDTRSIVLSAAALACVVGLLTMANAGTLRVLEQRSDLGLRRSLGATSTRIVRQVLLESSFVGLISAVAGALLGVVVSVVVCIANAWTPSINPWWILAGPAVGIAAGCLSGLGPARRAVASEPMEALLM